MNTNNFMSNNQNVMMIVDLASDFSARQQNPIIRMMMREFLSVEEEIGFLFTVNGFLLSVMAFLCLIPAYTLWEMQTILTDSLNFTTTTAAAIVNVHHGFKGMFGIVGAIVVDSYLTDHGMIFISSIFYSIGLIILGVGFSIIKYTDDVFIVRGFVLCGLIPIAAAQCSLTNSLNALILPNRKERALTVIKFLFSNIMINAIMGLLVISVSKAASPTVSPTKSSELSKKQSEAVLRIKFFFSAIAMFLVSGLSLVNLIRYTTIKPRRDRRNPLKYMVRVYLAAIFKRQLPFPDAGELYYGDPEHPLEHTTDTHVLLRFLNKAAVKETSNPEEERNNWLCTVTEVEETKCLLRMFPICTTFLAYGMVRSIGDTFFLDQVSNMDEEFPGYRFLLLSNLALIVTKELYNVMISKKLPATGKRYAPAIEYAMGMVLLSLCCSVASWVELEVYHNTHTRHTKYKMSIFWLIPQFLIYGAMEGFAADSIQQFFSDQLPSSMTQYAQVFADGITGAGSFLTIFLVLVTNAATKWFSATDYQLFRFYHLCTVVGISIFFAYTFAAVRYSYRENDQTQGKDRSEVEGDNNKETKSTRSEDQRKYISSKSLQRRPSSSHQSSNLDNV